MNQEDKTTDYNLIVIDGETLLDMNLSPPKFCVKSLLPQGLSILGGAPKVGKSWMVMDLCVRVAKGEPIWNPETTYGAKNPVSLRKTRCYRWRIATKKRKERNIMKNCRNIRISPLIEAADLYDPGGGMGFHMNA